MYRRSRVAVVMPAYNVERHIVEAVRSVPQFVDHLLVVDDASTDGTAVQLRRVDHAKLAILRHEGNRGVGAAIATGYQAALRRGADVIAVMAGDGQMDPRDLPAVLDPVVTGVAEYAKGNRFRHPHIWRAMPKARLIGNLLLSVVTKLTSGYYDIFDSQCGFTAVSARALIATGGRFFARYGYPNDMLARLRPVGARVVDVPVRPIYQGQSSGIRPWTVLYPISFVLVASWLRRLWGQYLRPDRPRVLLEAINSVGSRSRSV